MFGAEINLNALVAEGRNTIRFSLWYLVRADMSDARNKISNGRDLQSNFKCTLPSVAISGG